MTHTNHSEAAPIALAGQRLLHGKIYTFDAEALNDYLAQRAFDAAPADLSSLDDEELTSLLYSSMRVWSMRRGCDVAAALSGRIEAERRARRIDQ